VIEAITEHVENAGVHSGMRPSSCRRNAFIWKTIRRTKKITRDIVKALKINGPFNIQFIAKNNAIQVIECNIRSSRSFPFVSKVTDHNFIEIATRVMLGQFSPAPYETLELDYVGVKTPQFSYQRLKGAQSRRSRRNGFDGRGRLSRHDLLEAFFLSWLSTEQSVRRKRILVSIGGDKRSETARAVASARSARVGNLRDRRDK
jgi:carbamoyl-phosphate synthase large subunit